MGILDLNWDPFESTDEEGDFFAGLWTDRTEDAYKDFFSGGWKDPKEWFNPGGVMANPAQQIADPGNFFTAEEHQNWLKGDVSERTQASAIIAGMLYGGGALASGYGGSGGLSGAAEGNLLASEGIGGAGTIGQGTSSSLGPGISGGSGGSSIFSDFDFMDLLGNQGGGMGGSGGGTEGTQPAMRMAPPQQKQDSSNNFLASLLRMAESKTGERLGMSDVGLRKEFKDEEEELDSDFSFDFLF